MLTHLNVMSCVLIAYLLSFVFFLSRRIVKRDLLVLGDLFLRLGFVFHTFLVLSRWLEARRPPLANMYEALVLFAWCIALVYIVFSLFRKISFLGAPVSALVLVMMNVIARLDSTIIPLVPALQSPWISVHVVTYFIGYGGMTLSFVAGLYFLVIHARDKALARRCDEVGYHFIAFAFPFLTVGMTTGSIWANAAWGTWWSWDPKETCSLITWLAYALYLHLRIFRGWSGAKAAWLSCIGYLAVLFTFVGVNFILPGLHSYG